MRIPHPALSAVVATLGMLSASTGVAATIVVNSTAADVTAANGACTLPEAVANANADSDTTAGDCAAGSGADEILLSGAGYPANIPTISSELTLRGAGADLTLIGPVRVSSSGDLTVEAVSVRPDWPMNYNEGALTVRNSALSSGILNTSVLELRNSSINGADSCGVFNLGGTARIVNSTLTDNFGPPCYLCFEQPCDISSGFVAITSSTVGVLFARSQESWLRNSVVLECPYFSTYDGPLSLGGNISPDPGCGLDHPTDLPDTNPSLAYLGDNGGGTLTAALLPGSPAIDAIAPEDCTFDDDGDPQTPGMPLTEDQRGALRPRDGDGDGIARCDIGAYEAARACEDQSDNDGDGLVDFAGGDPGCDGASDPSERSPSLVCDDGRDNDGDNFIDYSGDAGCDSPADTSERGPAFVCDDGLDNDGDGSPDYPADGGCDSRADTSERSPALVCDDGLDNDSDGFTDYPADVGCPYPGHPSESEKLGGGKALVCHRGERTRLVAERTLEAHLAHGDSEGFCPAESVFLVCHRGEKTMLARGKSLDRHIRHGDAPHACLE